jgi:hypothetical protein
MDRAVGQRCDEVVVPFEEYFMSATVAPALASASALARVRL